MKRLFSSNYHQIDVPRSDVRGKGCTVPCDLTHDAFDVISEVKLMHIYAEQWPNGAHLSSKINILYIVFQLDLNVQIME